LRSSKIAETAYFGPEAEFFILDHVAYNINEYSNWYKIDSREGFWNTGSEQELNLGHKISFPKSIKIPILNEIRTAFFFITAKLFIGNDKHKNKL
jgi:hypothetical protein